MGESELNNVDMSGFETKLNLLRDLLQKKKAFLMQILSITENQESILVAEFEIAKSDVTAVDGMFSQMNDEKQKLIDELIHSDRFFDKVFKEISPEFEMRAPSYKPIIFIIQDLIRQVTDLDVKVRVQEQKNKLAIRKVDSRTDPRLLKGKADFTKASKDYMIKQYESKKK